MGLALDFTECGPRPYRGKYLIDAGDGWKHRNGRLKNSYIEKALNGKAQYGFYGASVTDCVALDLDDHSGGGWKDDRPTPHLLGLYEKVRGELSTPSMVFRSPHGLHTYYKLESMYPAPILNRLATEATIQHGAEVRPTMQLGLRIPCLLDRLNPGNLEPVPGSGLNDVPVKYAGELFGIGHTRQVLREQIEEQTGGARGYSAQAEMIAKAEGKVLNDGLSGATNAAICNLAPVYLLSGYTLEMAVERFSMLIHRADYSGELNNPHRLRQRMASLYRGIAKDGFFKTDRQMRQIEPSLFDFPLIDALAKAQPFARQRTEPIRRFVSGLIDWVNYQDAIKADPGAMAVWNYLYPYHRHNLRNGWYPLPQSVLESLNDRYNTIMPYLIETGFLTPAPFGYQAAGYFKGKYQPGVCKHYGVNKHLETLNL